MAKRSGKVRRIISEEAYRNALAHIEALSHLPLGSDATEKLDDWVQAVDEYEERRDGQAATMGEHAHDEGARTVKPTRH